MLGSGFKQSGDPSVKQFL